MIALDIEPREEELPDLSIPLRRERRPAMVEPDKGSASDVDDTHVRGQLQIDLEHFFDRLHAMGIHWIQCELPAACHAQGLARQLIARGRNDALDHGLNGLL